MLYLFIYLFATVEKGIANQASARRETPRIRASSKAKVGRGTLQANNDMALRKAAQDNQAVRTAL